MKAGAAIPRVDLQQLPHEMLRSLAQDFDNEAYGRMIDEENLNDVEYRNRMIAIIHTSAPSTALH